MKFSKNRIAALIGLLISIPTLIEGSVVLAGLSRPDQIVLTWLVVYNVSAAVFSLYVIREIWNNSSRGRKLSLLIFMMHFSVLFILILIYFSTGMVAVKSIMAMTMRSSIWALIYYLARKNAA